MDFVFDMARELMKRGDLFDEAKFSARRSRSATATPSSAGTCC